MYLAITVLAFLTHSYSCSFVCPASKMRMKIDSKKYGAGPAAFKKLYEDFLLVFDNCYAYNPPDGEVIEEAARVFALLPEAFASAAQAVAKR